MEYKITDYRGALLYKAEGNSLQEIVEEAIQVGAHLDGANLRFANLVGANLREFRQDLIAEILRLPNELEALKQALVDGKVDGSTYAGECACLAGTLARIKGTEQGKPIPCNGFSFPVDYNSPRERWFFLIKEGDTPESNQAAKLAVEWIDEAIAIRDHIREVA